MKKVTLISCLVIALLTLLMNNSFARAVDYHSLDFYLLTDNDENHEVTLLDLNKDSDGKYQYLNSEFTNNQLSFYVSNGMEDAYSKHDIKAHLCVFVSESFGNISKNDIALITIKMICNNEVYLGKAIYITDTVYGSGYIFSFYDDDHHEILFELPGAKFYKEKVTVVIEDAYTDFDTEIKIIVEEC